KIEELAEILSQGYFTHDHPITFEDAKRLGLPVSKEMPVEIYQLMKLFPQPVRSVPSVEYLPLPKKKLS
ncbi:MAG: SDH family Clp fold serine proteinase, partial [Caldimicrobium sp.]